MPYAAQTASASAPFVKFANLGDTFVGAYAGGKNRQQRDYKSGDDKFKADGKPALEEVMHFIAMPGTTAVTGNLEKGDTYPIAEGDHVCYAVNGFKWGQVIEARKALPEAFGFKAGQTCSSDVYTFTVVAYSATTDNAAGAKKAGFNVEEGRIVMRTVEEHEKWVLNQVRKNANSNAAKDFEVSVRRIDDTNEKAWMQAADELFLAKPWERETAATSPAPSAPPQDPTDPGPSAWDDTDDPF